MKLYVFLADGFETIEALTPVDILRRGGVAVDTVSIKNEKLVLSAQKVPVMADKTFEECNFEDGDGIFLPGGVPGTPNLEAHAGLKALIDDYYKEGKLVTAICAAPSILGHHNILQGKRATCFPGYEKDLYGATATGEGVVTDGNVITGKGMGKSVDMGLAILSYLTSADNAKAVSDKIQY